MRARSAQVLLACLAVLVLAGAAQAGYSPLWGKNGEAWSASGRLTDFSFAGYRQGKVALPNPPVTRWVAKTAGVSDTEALVAALAWAHRQPTPKNGQYIVIGVPAGTWTLTKQLRITKPRIVVRGMGAGKTILDIPKSLTGVQGPSKYDGGYYINSGAFLEVAGRHTGMPISSVTSSTARGARKLTVKSAAKLAPGMMIFLNLNDRNGNFIRELFLNQIPPPAENIDGTIVRFAAKIESIHGQVITLERTLPWPVRPEFGATIFARSSTVYEVGIEGLTFNFAWSVYPGHHLETGFNAIDHQGAFDCWARDIETINADSAFLSKISNAITITDWRMRQTKSRMGKVFKYDGHWGASHGAGTDFLVKNFYIEPKMVHSVGAGGWGMLSVYTNGTMRDGNLESHRNLAGQLLFTDINVGAGTYAFYNSGPKDKGPSTQAYTTYWNIRAAGGKALTPPNHNVGRLPPGDCSFGPALNFMGVNLDKRYKLCTTWVSQPSATLPQNLYQAQLKRRLG